MGPIKCNGVVQEDGNGSPTKCGVRDSAAKNSPFKTFAEHKCASLQQCKGIMEHIQATMKHFYDHNRPTHDFSPGDQILLDLGHVGVSSKCELTPRYIGPYPNIKLTIFNTYKIGLPPGTKLHDELHVSYLRPYTLDNNTEHLNNVPASITREGHDGWQVQAPLAARVRAGEKLYNVRWYSQQGLLARRLRPRGQNPTASVTRGGGCAELSK